MLLANSDLWVMIGKSASDSGSGDCSSAADVPALETGDRRVPAELLCRHKSDKAVTKEQWNTEIASLLCANRTGVTLPGMET